MPRGKGFASLKLGSIPGVTPSFSVPAARWDFPLRLLLGAALGLTGGARLGAPALRRAPRSALHPRVPSNRICTKNAPATGRGTGPARRAKKQENQSGFGPRGMVSGRARTAPGRPLGREAWRALQKRPRRRTPASGTAPSWARDDGPPPPPRGPAFLERPRAARCGAAASGPPGSGRQGAARPGRGPTWRGRSSEAQDTASGQRALSWFGR